MALFRFRKTPAPSVAPASDAAARVPDDVLVHAIGDVHGRLDLLTALLATIGREVAVREPREHRVILLGDLVDRGPESAGVIDLCTGYDWGETKPGFVIGNHEELMLGVLDGDAAGMRFWIANGGDATLASYGVPDALIRTGTADAIMAEFSQRVPPRHLRFLHAMSDHVAIGDYWFVHAGVKPGRPLARQKPKDLRWIRGEFLDYADPHGGMVVHGHTISDGVDEQVNRIGIDTGAYETGRLTAIGLQGAERWYLST